jgi:hypothetical protein
MADATLAAPDRARAAGRRTVPHQCMNAGLYDRAHREG